MLIGLNGKAGAGKDTVADMLMEVGFVRYAFADAVKAAADAISEVVYLPLHDQTLKSLREEYTWDELKRDEDTPEARRLLQLIGTELGRQVLGENCWVDIVNAKWANDGYPDAVITDLRFENEQSFVNDNGGYVIEILRPDNPNAIPATHASEQFVPEPWFTIDNDGTIDELAEKVGGLIRYIALDEAYNAE